MTATAMAVLRATVLGDCGGDSSNEDGCRNSGGEDNSDGSNGVCDNHPFSPCHARFVTHHVIANAITHVVTVTSSFVNLCNEEGNGNGDGDGN